MLQFIFWLFVALMFSGPTTDEIIFLFGNTIFGTTAWMLQRLPFSTIFAKIVPPGMEAAVSAYLNGILDFCAIVISYLIGSGVISWSGMKTVGMDCDYTSLPSLVFIAKIMVPITVGIPVMFLIPNALETESLIDWERENGRHSERSDDDESASSADQASDDCGIDEDNQLDREEGGEDVGLLA
jgi:hypothetical protein